MFFSPSHDEHYYYSLSSGFSDYHGISKEIGRSAFPLCSQSTHNNMLHVGRAYTTTCWNTFFCTKTYHNTCTTLPSCATGWTNERHKQFVCEQLKKLVCSLVILLRGTFTIAMDLLWQGNICNSSLRNFRSLAMKMIMLMELLMTSNRWLQLVNILAHSGQTQEDMSSKIRVPS